VRGRTTTGLDEDWARRDNREEESKCFQMMKKAEERQKKEKEQRAERPKTERQREAPSDDGLEGRKEEREERKVELCVGLGFGDLGGVVGGDGLRRGLLGVLLDGQEEFEFGRELVLGVEAVGEVDAADAAVGVNLDP